MGEIRLTSSLRSALDEVVDLFRAHASTAYIASEFLISSEMQRTFERQSKFGRALLQAETSLNEHGFHNWQPPHSLTEIIGRLRAELGPRDDEAARGILLSVLAESDPAIIRDVSVD
jgi:hypothetical protein